MQKTIEAKAKADLRSSIMIKIQTFIIPKVIIYLKILLQKFKFKALLLRISILKSPKLRSQSQKTNELSKQACKKKKI